MTVLKTGLNSFQLKILALFAMTLDHITYFLGDDLGLPSILRIIGRIALPLFIFIMANGVKHTRSRTRYALRLYLFYVGMLILNSIIVPLMISNPESLPVMLPNVFGLLFFVVLTISCLENTLTSFKTKRYFKIPMYVAIASLPFWINAARMELIMSVVISIEDFEMRRNIMLLIMAFLPTLEGGYTLVILGVGFYFLIKNRIYYSLFYAVFCGVIAMISYNATGTFDIQNYMIFALPFLLIYNYEKGRGMKQFFYIYYPVHVIILILIADKIVDKM